MSILFAALIWGTLFNMIISYTVVYYLVPKFFIKKKYIAFAIGLLLLLIIIFFLNIINSIINKQMTVAIGQTGIKEYFKSFGIRIFGNPPLICGLLLSLKKMKDWYLKQNENKMLARENANAELQLLKAQIHPHFLFNTLNNIYFFILSEPVKAEGLVEKLENLLYYMINECNATAVSLNKEISMINDYFELEKIRYGDRLDVELKITGDYDCKMIAPLLMIPFIENSFKHGTSKILRDPWIKLFIQADEEMLHFTLTNNKPAGTIPDKKNGIGLSNVKKRLAILHPEKHYLTIEPTENTFTINMQIPLEQEIKTVKSINTETYNL
jgi:LytS/YehU family sensor histidine kinase